MCSVVELYLLLVEVLVSHKLVLQSWTKCVQHWHGEVNGSGWRRRTPTSRSLQISAHASLIFQYNRVLCKLTPTIPLKADEKCTIHLPLLVGGQWTSLRLSYSAVQKNSQNVFNCEQLIDVSA